MDLASLHSFIQISKNNLKKSWFLKKNFDIDITSDEEENVILELYIQHYVNPNNDYTLLLKLSLFL